MKPKIKTKKVTTVEIEVDGSPREFTLSRALDDTASEVTTTVTAEHVIIGYLKHDPVCGNPLDDYDGYGAIYSFNNRHENFKEPYSLTEWAGNPRAVALSYFEHGLCKWGVAGTMNSTPDFRWDGTEVAGLWIPDSSTDAEIDRRAPAYSIGHITRHPTLCVDKYVATSDATGEQQRFPDWYVAFQWLDAKVDKKVPPTEKGIRRAAEEMAAQACEEYTNWCNGECYTVVVEEFLKSGANINRESYGGIVGYEAAKEVLTGQMKLHENRN